jgi:hypothetical protein
LFDHLDEVTMIDFGTAKILSHRRNIQRCVRLLATEPTEVERQYLQKRIAEERAELERLEGTQRDGQFDYARQQVSTSHPLTGTSHPLTGK